MDHRKRIALVAHTSMQDDLLAWVRLNRALLREHELYATSSTRTALKRELGVEIRTFQRGEMVRWAVMGAVGQQPRLDVLIFFWRQPEALPPDPDERALLRLATLWNIPVACNRASADCMISSPVLTDGRSAA